MTGLSCRPSRRSRPGCHRAASCTSGPPRSEPISGVVGRRGRARWVGDRRPVAGRVVRIGLDDRPVHRHGGELVGTVVRIGSCRGRAVRAGFGHVDDPAQGVQVYRASSTTLPETVVVDRMSRSFASYSFEVWTGPTPEAVVSPLAGSRVSVRVPIPVSSPDRIVGQADAWPMIDGVGHRAPVRIQADLDRPVQRTRPGQLIRGCRRSRRRSSRRSDRRSGSAGRSTGRMRSRPCPDRTLFRRAGRQRRRRT